MVALPNLSRSSNPSGSTVIADTERELATRLYDIGLALTSNLDLTDVLLKVLESAVMVVDADVASVHTYSEELDKAQQEPFKRVATIGASQPPEQYATPRPGGQTYRIARNRETIWSNSAQQDPVFKDSPFTQGERICSVAGIPLVVGDSVVGVLYFNYYEPDQITDGRRRAMQLFGNQAAVAILNARLFEEQQQREQMLVRLLEEGNRIREAVNEGLDAVMAAIAVGACKIVGADCAVVYPYDPSRKAFYEIKSVASYGVMQPFHLTDKPRLTGGMAALVRSEGAIIVHDLDRERRELGKSNFIQREGIRAFMGVSLTAGDAELGVLYIDFRSPHFFDQDEQNIIRILGNHAAVAIQNSRQIQAIRSAQEQRLAAERWATLGKAAANLAHRINNTGAVVPVAVQDLHELLAGAELAKDIREQVDGDLKRIATNTRHTLELADVLLKPFTGGPARRFDLNGLVNDAVELSSIPNNVALQVVSQSDVASVIVGPLLIDVLVELITNAVKAMPTGGTLRIDGMVEQTGQEIVLRVSDTGVGIPKEHQETIFDLFYTTGDDSLGFGLWWIKAFVEQQGGNIELLSRVDEGTTFTLRLPIHSELESVAH